MPLTWKTRHNVVKRVYNKMNEDKPKKELVEIRPSIVSLVGMGANAEILFVAKSIGQGQTVKAEAIEFFESLKGRISLVTETIKGAEVDDEVDENPDFDITINRIRESLVDLRTIATTEKSIKVTSIFKDKTLTLIESFEQAVAEVCKAFDEADDETASSLFVEKLDSLIESLDLVIAGIVESKAVWTTAYINKLPDSAFLYIKPGGEKDEEGKTVPRTNRMFPYKNAEGSVDLPHLRNAIARIPQSSLSQDLKDQLQAKARKILAQETTEEKQEETSAKASKEEKMSKYMELAKSAPEDEAPEINFEEVKKAATTANAKLMEIMSSLGVSVDDAKGKDRWEVRWQIGDVVDILIDAAKLEDLLGGTAAKSEDDAPAEGDDTTAAKSTDVPTPPVPPATELVTGVSIEKALSDAMTKALAPLTEKIETVTKKLDEHEEVVAKMRTAREASQGGDADGTTQVTQKSSGGKFDNLMPSPLRAKKVASS